MNIKFAYLYRDADNYKLFNYVVMSNRSAIPLVELDTLIRKSLISSEFFDPIKLGVPKLEFPEYDFEVDHDWHEYDYVSSTEDECTIKLDVLDLITLLARNLH